MKVTVILTEFGVHERISKGLVKGPEDWKSEDKPSRLQHY